MNRWQAWTGCALVSLSLIALCGCQDSPDDMQVRAAITAMAEAAQAGKGSGVVAPLSEDFDGNGGELDRPALGNLLRVFALRGERIGVTMEPISVARRGQRMVATFTVTLTSRSGLLPDQMGLYQVESAWRQDGGEWRCYSARWKRAL